MISNIYKTNVYRFCSNIKSINVVKKNNFNKNTQDLTTSNHITNHNEFRKNLHSYSLQNNLSFDEDMQQYGQKLFLKSTIEMKHILTDTNINEFKEGIKKNDYMLYDKYKNLPEILVLGRSNVGKSSLINKLFLKDISFTSKKPGKTQNLEFFLINYNKRDTGFIIDSPGFGYVNGPVILRKKFKYLIYSYINFGVRLKMILYLINGEYGIKKVDMEELEFLNKFNKKIQIVLTKVDTLNNIETVQYATQVSNFTKPLINIRKEIFLTSSKTQYGLNNLRSCIAYDLLNSQLEGIRKLNKE